MVLYASKLPSVEPLFVSYLTLAEELRKEGRKERRKECLVSPQSSATFLKMATFRVIT